MVTYKKKHSPVGFYCIQWNPSIADIMGPPLRALVIEMMFDFWLGLQHMHCVGLCSIKFVTDKKKSSNFDVIAQLSIQTPVSATNYPNNTKKDFNSGKSGQLGEREDHQL